MQVDMHYGATAVLARAAGFNEQDAQVIGYAAQYVDDAQDGRDILVNGEPFSPLATANSPGAYIHSRRREVWRKVYLPFHFLPPGPIASDGDVFLTQPRGLLADKLLAEVAGEGWGERLYHLCRLGVALHTVADTWSHQGFSGRWHRENDVRKLVPLAGGGGLGKAMEDARRRLLAHANTLIPLPVVHFQAGFFPDYPFLEWRAVFADSGGPGRVLHLNNQDEYYQACRFLYDWLLARPRDQPAGVTSWETMEPGIRQCLANSQEGREERCLRWQETFAGLFPASGGLPNYDKHQWEVEALGEPLRQDIVDNLAQDLGGNHDYQAPAGFEQTRWVQFHRAAARQRAWLGQYVSV